VTDAGVVGELLLPPIIAMMRNRATKQKPKNFISDQAAATPYKNSFRFWMNLKGGQNVNSDWL